jgi:dipeptidyl aminopeptidase/acylaminoacyl peptidase
MRVLAAVLSSLVLMGIAAPKVLAQEKVPVEDFFRKPKLSGVTLSPDGKHLAFVAPSTKGDDRMVLAMAPVESPQKWTVVAHMRDADVSGAEWVNNSRLVFRVSDRQSAMGEQKGGGLYAVNLDGSEFVWLIAREYGEQDHPIPSKRPLLYNHVYVRTIGDGSDDVLGTLYARWRDVGEATYSRPIRLNTKTKGVKVIEDDSPKGSRGWAVNRTATAASFVTTYLDGRVKTLYKKAGRWEVLTDYDAFVADAEEVIDLAFVDGKGQMFVTAERKDEMRTRALYRFDPEKKKKESEPVFAVKGFDFNGRPLFDGDDSRLLGLTYVSDASGVVWFDPVMKAMQEEVDRQLPGTNNLIGCTKCVQAKHVLVAAYSDRQPLVYFLFDVAAKKLSLVGASRPWIDAKRMATQDLVYVRTRDGLQMPVYVTKPQGKGPWPAVTLVHGGPWVRGGAWGWDADAQFLASRGYLVIEPEFRGSLGYGSEFVRRSFKQWGLAMQDDVTDATQWAVKEGLADSKRLVIAGASYGGYATMMGLVKEPDLYRAGINWVGVTDIDLIYDIGWSDANDDWLRLGMPRMVGDQRKDRVQLDATSPLKQAARITKPVLMAYGTDDKRVPLPHGEKMRDALQRGGKVPVEWVAYRDEGHNWMLEATHIDFWKRVEAFLAKHAN